MDAAAAAATTSGCKQDIYKFRTIYQLQQVYNRSLTDHDDVSKDLVLLVDHVGAIPAVISKLVAALSEAEFGTLTHNGHGVGRFSTQLTLTFNESGYTGANGSPDHC